MYISFSHPFYLFFLFVIPVIIFLHFFGLKNIKGRALKFANFEAIAKIKGIDLYSKDIFLLIFNILFVLLLVLALSGLTLHKQMSASSFSFVVAIDSSASMSATDIKPNRISAAKETAKDFIDKLPFNSYAGIISFSGDSYIEQKLTRDKYALKYAIDNIEISPVGGTDLFEAVVNSVELLENKEKKAIVLISDGQINMGNFKEVIDYAKYNDVVVNSIGIGTVEGGKAIYGLSKLDEDSLKSLAYNTGGRYFNVQNKQEMDQSFNEIIQITKKLDSIDLSTYLLISAIVLFVLKQFLLSINKIIW